MCIGEQCGRFRIYEVSDFVVTDFWTGVDPTPPTDPTKIYLIGDGLGSADNTAKGLEKFEKGVRRRWGKAAHIGDKCPGECRCVRTDEKIGGEAEKETRKWRQPMKVGTGEYVVRGTYSIKFQDYKGTCDAGDESGPVGPD